MGLVTFHTTSINASGVKVECIYENKKIGRAFLYFLKNDLHNTPFCFIEDVFVEEAYRGKGIGKELVVNCISLAKENSCYKIICTSRYGKEKVHSLYKSVGFKDHGIEFRMDI